MRGLSKLWNTLITISSKDNILLLNDDLIISNSHFFKDLEEKDTRFFLINDSFSHFMVNKEEMHNLGYFDERFLGFGLEDVDIRSRYAVQNNSAMIPSEFIGGIVHLDSNADNVSVYADGYSISKLTLTDSGLFEINIVAKDSTNYDIWGYAEGADASAFADQ